MCVLGHVLKTQPDSLHSSVLTSFPACSEPKVIQEQEFKAFAGLSGACIQVMPACGLLDFQEYVGAFQSFHGHIIPQLFLLRFFIILSFAPQIVHYLGQSKCLTVASDCFSPKHPEKRLLVLDELRIRSDKDSFVN